ncbi:MAG: biotin--[acetyl-CoA-carboxylase] ligase [Actinomycetia bacterium]|nr:biotin--[acetyl-CoA-carboxylase] ligase [Actinomycetes bacterium]
MSDLSPVSSTRTPLVAAVLRRRLVLPDRLWTSLEVADTVGSSNVALAQKAKAAAPAGAVLVAEEQTAGQGRRGRGWSAPQYSSVMVSVLVRPGAEPARWGWIPLLTAVAIVDALQELDVHATVKWPNDVLVEDRKIAGVLCEVVPTPGGSAVVVGWGINVDQQAAELPVESATSVRLEGGSLDRATLILGVLDAWESWYRRWLADDATLRETYVRYSSTLGQEVRLDLPDGRLLRGTATSIDVRGGLVVMAEGQEHVVPAADVVHVRPDQD